MTSRKRNEWLEADLDDEEENNDSEDQEESRGQSLAHRSTKRRKVGHDKLSPEENSDDQDQDNDVSELGETKIQSAEEEASTLKVNLKIEKKLAKARDTTSRSGVIYISRIPPFMKPHTVKNLLSPYAPSGLGRIFLTPESFETRQSRLRGGGNKKRTFTDGWVEFVSKKEAKVVVETLNTRTIGGKKGGYYVDDVWNLKYLKGFKWRHLTEQIANENAERAARMRAEGSSSRREMNEFLRNVDHSKIEGTREQRRKAKADKLGVKSAVQDSSRHQSRRTVFRQNRPVKLDDRQLEDTNSEEVTRVLSRIF